MTTQVFLMIKSIKGQPQNPTDLSHHDATDGPRQQVEGHYHVANLPFLHNNKLHMSQTSDTVADRPREHECIVRKD